jgi:NAD(P)-dependent dehydrogenase (short-subunit alcohol dehydrogenase family)
MIRPSRRRPLYGDRYRDWVAVVTGASAGLGRQLCADLARAGATVIGLSRNAERLATLCEELRAISPASRTIVCDVADTGALCATLRAVIETDGGIDLLINNAAQDPGVRLTDITVDDFRRTFDVNFFAPVAATLAVLPSMHARGSGTIVNVSSDGGRLPSPGPGAYPASKAALSAFTESTSFRLGPRGIHLHVVYPAFMATDLGLGALARGLRQPPRLTVRRVDAVSHIILARAGTSSLEISALRLIDVAMVFRYLCRGSTTGAASAGEGLSLSNGRTAAVSSWYRLVTSGPQ